MGHREDLLEGAKRCLIEKGYARTTTRDIVATSGANLASIGYHFGSKEALLNEALIQASGEWGEELERVLAHSSDAAAGSEERFDALWTGVIELFSSHRRLWAANFEIFAQTEHAPEVRKAFAKGLEQARQGMGRLFLDQEADDKLVWAVGSFYQALLTGVMAQWLIDPERAPVGHDLTDALKVIVEGFQSSKDPARGRDG